MSYSETTLASFGLVLVCFSEETDKPKFLAMEVGIYILPILAAVTKPDQLIRPWE